MFNNVSQTYSLTDASSEILLMLLGAFIIGMMLGWLLKPNNKGVSIATWAWVLAKKATVSPIKADDLQMIEWVGPAIEKLLHKHGIQTYAEVMMADVSGLEDILEKGGARFKMHTPTTWPDQARLADAGKWSELEEYQDILNWWK